MSAETWRPMPGWAGVYEVSDHGRVRSLDRVSASGKRVAGRILTPNYANKGYASVQLNSPEGVARWKVHALVLTAFVCPRPEGMVTRHLDGERTNNHLSNLAWGTYSENEADKARHWAERMGVPTFHCLRRHEARPDNVYTRPNGYRECRECRRIQQVRRNRSRSRAA